MPSSSLVKLQNLSYLWLDDDKVEIRNAEYLKNATVKETDDKIRDELGDFYIAFQPSAKRERNFAGLQQS